MRQSGHVTHIRPIRANCRTPAGDTRRLFSTGVAERVGHSPAGVGSHLASMREGGENGANAEDRTAEDKI